MGVYVDDAIWPWRDRLWCHLVADTDEELHAFGERLGLQRAWLQHRPARPWLDHYDLPDYGRERAIELGATPVDRRQIVAVIRRKRDAARGGPPAYLRVDPSSAGHPGHAVDPSSRARTTEAGE